MSGPTVSMETYIYRAFDKLYAELQFSNIVVTNTTQELLQDLENEIISISKQKNTTEGQETYEDGYEHGYQNGDEYGYDRGYEQGYEARFDEVYSVGFEAGVRKARELPRSE